jgi:hypothetical protein
MTWSELEMARVHGEFLSLSGADPWDRVVEVTWQRQELERTKSSEKQRDRRSRQHGRIYHRDYQRAWRQRNREEDGAVRCCAVCSRMFTLTRYQIELKTRFCSRECAGRYGQPARLITFNGKSRTVKEWAKLYGVSVTTIRDRMRKGRALDAAPPPPPHRITTSSPTRPISRSPKMKREAAKTTAQRTLAALEVQSEVAFEAAP